MNGRITIRFLKRLDLIFVWPVLLYRYCQFGYTYRRIYLGDGSWAILDQRDYYKLSKFRWYIKGSFGKFYAVRNYKYDSRQTKTVSMHREIMNAPRGLLVDHRNRNGLDNRRENLRLATCSQNNCNKPKRKNTSSRFVGVCYNKAGKRWGVHIQSKNRNKGKKIFLGYFDLEIDAARAYDTAARKYHGEFAQLNFPEEENGKEKGRSKKLKGNPASPMGYAVTRRKNWIPAFAGMTKEKLRPKGGLRPKGASLHPKGIPLRPEAELRKATQIGGKGRFRRRIFGVDRRKAGG